VSLQPEGGIPAHRVRLRRVAPDSWPHRVTIPLQRLVPPEHPSVEPGTGLPSLQDLTAVALMCQGLYHAPDAPNELHHS
jgi:hypothetical protein